MSGRLRDLMVLHYTATIDLTLCMDDGGLHVRGSFCAGEPAASSARTLRAMADKLDAAGAAASAIAKARGPKPLLGAQALEYVDPQSEVGQYPVLSTFFSGDHPGSAT